ncbi:PI-PLC X domain-containing protein 1-like [Neocloeon triangulifer]|uniref:PI-PLC X domain-containing protein 1-like n=1 Tax=Neocloeon triangulifer TaxID=2078957 RepID=UPI00286F279E|nr:PI-PLC X domain-containing protein 1-like [Neocloeon triangulifer]
MMVRLAVVSILLLAVPNINSAPVHPSRECKAGLHVFLTVNSIANNSIVNRLELNWVGATPSDGEWIGIFASDPVTSGVTSFLERLDLNPSSGSDGFYVTKTMVENFATNSSELGFVSRCLNYHIGYVSSGGQVLASGCLRIEPTWMADMTGLGDQIIKDIFIPGTHDSGAYGNYDPILGDTLVIKYTVTQDEDLLAQLIRGVRYLDIRVGYYGPQRAENVSGFWINHGAFQMHRLEKVLAQVKEFLANTEKEIVIFDVQEFPNGFTSIDIHHKLVQFLEQEFSNYIIPRGASDWNSKISDLMASGRIIISYDDTDMVNAYPWIWRRVDHKWGNVRTTEDLFAYLSSLNSNPPLLSAWSAMAELTPTAWDVVTDELGGLRKMADSVNRNVTTWYQGSWGQTANVVAVDFYRGSDIIGTAIEWNKQRINGRINCVNRWERNYLRRRLFQFFQFKFF